MNLLSTGPQSELNKHQTMTNAAFMKTHLRLWLIALSLAPAAAHAADSFLVENGESRAEIIIANLRRVRRGWRRLSCKPTLRRSPAHSCPSRRSLPPMFRFRST